MWLQLDGVYTAADEMLDYRISDSAILWTADAAYIAITSGRYGGISLHRIRADGTLEPGESRLYPPFVRDATRHELSVAQYNGETLLLFGATDTTVMGYLFRDDGSFGPIRLVERMDLEAAYTGPGDGILQGLTLFSDIPTALLPADPWQSATVALHEITLGGQPHVLALGGIEAQVTSYRMEAGGGVTQVASLGVAQGLGIAAPSAMELVTLQGASYAVVAASATSALSVIALGADGGLTPVQQLIDTGHTHFRHVQDLAIAQAGDHAFAVAVGTDHGLTLFRILPSGHLVFLEAWHDLDGGALHTPLTVSAEVVGDRLHIATGAQNAPGLTHFTVDLTGLGVVQTASPGAAEWLSGGAGHDVLIAAAHNDTLSGGGGNDVLVSGPGRTVMTGGPGADLFVIRNESTLVEITDFRPGLDRLDLSDLPMLRNLDQLAILPNASGATIGYRDLTVQLTSFTGQPLSVEALFPDGLAGPDSIGIFLEEIPNPWEGRPPLLPGELPLPPAPPQMPHPDAVPGQYILGETLRDVLHGGPGDDFIYGGPGRDTLHGGGGNNTIFGGAGRDLIYGADGGNDLIYGGPGNDRMWGLAGDNTMFGGSGNNRFGGGPGDDLLVGGTGNDTIFGGPGNDTIFGGGGNNSLWGMRGDTLIFGGPGNDRIGGGRGNDTIHGGGGNNTIYGGLGDALIYGGSGNDELWGMDGNDTIYGGTGNDFIHGGRGDDVLHGGPGDDTLVGGPGADTFIFLSGDELCLIQDFTFSDGDRLELDQALWGGGKAASEVLDTFAQVHNGQTVLDFGDGDVLTLAGVSNLVTLADHIDII